MRSVFLLGGMLRKPKINYGRTVLRESARERSSALRRSPRPFPVSSFSWVLPMPVESSALKIRKKMLPLTSDRVCRAKCKKDFFRKMPFIRFTFSCVSVTI